LVNDYIQNIRFYYVQYPLTVSLIDYAALCGFDRDDDK